MIHRVAALALLLGVAACTPEQRGEPVASAAVSSSGVEQTWDRALVILPGHNAADRMATLRPLMPHLSPPTQPTPLVIYAHGCAGAGSEARTTMRLLAEHGFALVAPDYFARPDARTVCPDGDSRAAAAWTGGYYAGYVRRRLEEVAHAKRRAREEFPWVDPARIYVVGHSMGGATASQWPTADVAWVAVLGYDCLSNGQAQGLRVPASVPVLSITDRRDPWMSERFRGRSCAEFAFRRPFTSVTMDNGDHAIVAHPQAREALVRFLRGGARAN